MRNKHLMIYGSSYDRGLEHLLKMWPDIKKEVPDAQLRIFYGWNLFDVAYGDNPERQAWKEKMNKLMEQDGITHLGRISHEACIKEHESAGVWAYPTHFGEISCITAMRAQAYGSVPCVINYAALKETVQFGVKIDGDIYEPEVKELYKNSLIALLKDGKYQEEVRKEMMPWAKKKFAWSVIAKEWTKEFIKPRALEKEVEELMENNQSLKAWDLVKDTKSPLKDRVWLRVKHAFNDDEYKKYYSEDLVEIPVSEEIALDCTKLAPRFAWAVPKILKNKPKNLIDLGCADGYLCMTLANKGIECLGINLHRPSVEFALERAKKLDLDKKTGFVCEDLFNVKMKTDCVVMMEVLEHLPDPQKGVDHAMSLLTKDGFAVFSTPRTDHLGVEQHKAEVGHESWDDGKPTGHLRLFTEKEFKALFSKYEISDFFLDDEKCMNIEVRNK